MKTALAVLGQLALFFLFLAVFFAGGLLVVLGKDPFGGPHWFVHQTSHGPAWFVPSGLLLMTILWLVIVGIEAAAKRLRTAGLWTTLAYLAALIVGLISRFGFYTPSGL